MRLITIGCEYVGKTTLADALQAWGKPRTGANSTWTTATSASRTTATSRRTSRWRSSQAPPGLKERFQRMQIYYHIFVQSNCEDCIFGGYHIQEAIYGPRYYYPGTEVHYLKQVEGFLQPDTILVLMTADPDEIRARMKAAPHKFPLVPPEDVEEIQAEFEREFTASTIKRKVRLIRPASRPRRYSTGSSPRPICQAGPERSPEGPAAHVLKRLRGAESRGGQDSRFRAAPLSRAIGGAACAPYAGRCWRDFRRVPGTAQSPSGTSRR